MGGKGGLGSTMSGLGGPNSRTNSISSAPSVSNAADAGRTLCAALSSMHVIFTVKLECCGGIVLAMGALQRDVCWLKQEA